MGRVSPLRFAPALFLAITLGACRNLEEAAAQKTGGDPSRGRQVLHKYGCGSCHSIPGVAGAEGSIGPALDRIGSRAHLAGGMENTPENLMRWIRNPQEIRAGAAMPNLGVTEQDGRDIAAFLYTLQ